MNPYIDSPARQTQAQAAQVAIALQQLGHLSHPTPQQLHQALAIAGTRLGRGLELSPELQRQVGRRCGQMIALELLGVPMPNHGPEASSRAAAIARGKRAAEAGQKAQADARRKARRRKQAAA